MDPSEESRRLDALDPGERAISDLVGRPLHLCERWRLELRQIKIVEVGVEALRDTPGAIQYVGADETARRHAMRLEAFRERVFTRVEKEAAVIADSVPGRVLPREDRRVGRQGQRRRRYGVLEQDAFAREPIERRRRAVRQPVRAKSIGARRIERDEE